MISTPDTTRLSRVWKSEGGFGRFLFGIHCERERQPYIPRRRQRERERKGGNYRDNQSIVALIGKVPRERRRDSSPKPRLTTSLPFGVALSGGQTDSEVEEEE